MENITETSLRQWRDASIPVKNEEWVTGHVLRNMMSSATGDVVKWFVWLSETLVIESEKNTILGLEKELTYKSIASKS